MFIDSIRLTNEEINEINLVTWYEDKSLCIELDKWPHIETKTYNKYLQKEEEYNSAKKWPHRLTHDLYVKIIDKKKNKQYNFLIKEDYCYDGATIPRLFWRLIGAPSDPRFIVGALIHDVLCQHKDYVDRDRKLSTNVLTDCCKCTGTGAITRFLMYWSVEIFQIIIGKW